MNVVFLTPWYPTKEHRYGGVFVREYAKALQQHCNVIVLHCGIGDPTIGNWWAMTRETDQDLTDGVPSYRILFRPSRIPWLSWARNLGSVHRTVRTLSSEHGSPDLIHAHVYITGSSALLVGKVRQIPVVISEHWTAFPRKILSRGQIRRARAVFRMADAVLPVSRALQRSLELHGVKANFRVIPNVVDTELFRFDSSRPRAGAVLRLLTVSSLTEHKGLDVLFRALKLVDWREQQWHLDLVGDGHLMGRHEALVKELGLASNVTFHRQLLKKQVAELMRGADLFVLPSLVETFSVAVAEALASGVPAVVTRCGGPEEFVTERSGTVVAPDDAAGLAEGLSQSIERLSTFDRPIIAHEAQTRFGPAQVGATLYDLYVGLIHDRGRLAGRAR